MMYLFDIRMTQCVNFVYMGYTCVKRYRRKWQGDDMHTHSFFDIQHFVPAKNVKHQISCAQTSCTWELFVLHLKCTLDPQSPTFLFPM